MADTPTLPKGKDRGLTPDEVALAKSVFGDSIDYSQVRIHNDKIPGIKSHFQPDNVPVPASGTDVYYPGGVYADDLSAKNKSDFIHVMAYVWQFQDKISTPAAAEKWAWDNRNNIAGATNTVVDPAKDLKDYNIEQRARLIEQLYDYREDRAHPGAPQAPDPDGSLMLANAKTFLQQHPEAKAFAMKFLPLETGPDGQLRINQDKLKANREQQAANAIQTQQEDTNLLKVMSRFIADPGYLDLARPHPAPAIAPPPVASPPLAAAKTKIAGP